MGGCRGWESMGRGDHEGIVIRLDCIRGYVRKTDDREKMCIIEKFIE